MLHSALFWLVFETIIFIGAWFVIVRPALKQFRWSNAFLTGIDGRTRPFFAQIPIRLKGLWTTILGLFLTLFGAIPQMLAALPGQNIKWENYLDAKTASIVPVALGLLVIIVHTLEDKQAGKTEPPPT